MKIKVKRCSYYENDDGGGGGGGGVPKIRDEDNLLREVGIYGKNKRLSLEFDPVSRRIIKYLPNQVFLSNIYFSVDGTWDLSELMLADISDVVLTSNVEHKGQYRYYDYVTRSGYPLWLCWYSSNFGLRKASVVRPTHIG